VALKTPWWSSSDRGRRVAHLRRHYLPAGDLKRDRVGDTPRSWRARGAAGADRSVAWRRMSAPRRSWTGAASWRTPAADDEESMLAAHIAGARSSPTAGAVLAESAESSTWASGSATWSNLFNPVAGHPWRLGWPAARRQAAAGDPRVRPGGTRCGSRSPGRRSSSASSGRRRSRSARRRCRSRTSSTAPPARRFPRRRAGPSLLDGPRGEPVTRNAA